MNKERGFTIIEVLVVIVIILALEAIVWAYLARYDNKGKNSAIRGNLYTLATKGVEYFEKNGNYNGFCTSELGGALARNAIEALNVGGEFTCNCDDGSCGVDSTAWCACSTLMATSDVALNTVFCVDSSGVKKEVNDTCPSECPASGLNPGACK